MISQDLDRVRPGLCKRTFKGDLSALALREVHAGRGECLPVDFPHYLNAISGIGVVVAEGCDKPELLILPDRKARKFQRFDRNVRQG